MYPKNLSSPFSLEQRVLDARPKFPKTQKHSNAKPMPDPQPKHLPPQARCRLGRRSAPCPARRRSGVRPSPRGERTGANNCSLGDSLATAPPESPQGGDVFQKSPVNAPERSLRWGPRCPAIFVTAAAAACRRQALCLRRAFPITSRSPLSRFKTLPHTARTRAAKNRVTNPADLLPATTRGAAVMERQMHSRFSPPADSWCRRVGENVLSKPPANSFALAIAGGRNNSLPFRLTPARPRETTHTCTGGSTRRLISP